MAVRGAEAKKAIIKKILETFPDAFLCEEGKELRIPYQEGSDNVQIKCSFTCAKVNVGGGVGSVNAEVGPAVNTENREITKEEVSEVRDIIDKLGL